MVPRAPESIRRFASAYPASKRLWKPIWSLDGGEDQGRVRRSGGGDDHGVGPRTEHVLYLPGLSSDLRGYHLGPLRVGIPDEYPVNAWVAGQQAGVEGADTASPE